jgi:hypothetical protein
MLSPASFTGHQMRAFDKYAIEGKGKENLFISTLDIWSNELFPGQTASTTSRNRYRPHPKKGGTVMPEAIDWRTRPPRRRRFVVILGLAVIIIFGSRTNGRSLRHFWRAHFSFCTAGSWR